MSGFRTISLILKQNFKFSFLKMLFKENLIVSTVQCSHFQIVKVYFASRATRISLIFRFGISHLQVFFKRVAASRVLNGQCQFWVLITADSKKTPSNSVLRVPLDTDVKQIQNQLKFILNYFKVTCAVNLVIHLSMVTCLTVVFILLFVFHGFFTKEL